MTTQDSLFAEGIKVLLQFSKCANSLHIALRAASEHMGIATQSLWVSYFLSVAEQLTPEFLRKLHV